MKNKLPTHPQKSPIFNPNHRPPPSKKKKPARFFWINKEDILGLTPKLIRHQAEYVPKEKLEIAVSALKEIINHELYEGVNQGKSSEDIARDTLKELGE